AFAWVNRTAAAWLGAFGIDVPSDEIYERLTALATPLPPDNEGLVCEPLWRGTRRQPHATGTFRGVRFENFTPGHVARAVLTGIAAGLHSFYESAGESRPASVERIIGSGNGLRKNPLLRDILSQTFGLPVVLPAHHEEAAFGTALLAGSMTGMWPSLEDAGRCIRLVPSRADTARP
ncbi:MAG: FGGY-family carbohydrate kinase, partial [Planctomycetaceae bacterium]